MNETTTRAGYPDAAREAFLPALPIVARLRRSVLQPVVLLFLALGLPLGMSLAVLVPLGQVADEPAHLLKADSLLHGELIGHRRIVTDAAGRQRPQEGVVADGGLLSAIVSILHPNDMTPTRIDGAAFDRSRRAHRGGTGFFTVGTIAGYFPVFYLPAASALGLCRLFNAGAYTSFLTARFANLFVCLLMGAAALAIARRGRVLLLTTLLLPLSLSLAASVSQDGLLIAAAALAAACSTVVDRTRLLASPAWWTMTVLVACIVLAKPPYLPFVILLFLPLARGARWRLPSEMRLRLGALATILSLAAAWTVLTVRVASAPIFRDPEEAGPLWPGLRPAMFDRTDMAAQLFVLTGHPLRFLTLPLHSIWQHPEILSQMLSLLGWLNLRLPRELVIGWAAALICAGLADVVGRDRTGGWMDAALLLASSFAAVLLIYCSQYLSFTPVGWDWISGVQGRYFLPLLPLIALAFPVVSNRPAVRKVLSIPTLLAATAGVYMIPLAVVRFYYMGR